MKAEAVLMAMLALQSPGKSTYSYVAEVEGAVCVVRGAEGCRLESREEGEARYRVLAQAIAEVSGGQPTLAALLVAVAHGESGFRRDVMMGLVRGDDGRSWGVFQRNLGEGTTHRGWFGIDLVGLDLQSQRRAAATAGEDLLRARNYCVYIQGRFEPRCVFNVYGGLPTLVPDDSRVTARVRSYARAWEILRCSTSGPRSSSTVNRSK